MLEVHPRSSVLEHDQLQLVVPAVRARAGLDRKMEQNRQERYRREKGLTSAIGGCWWMGGVTMSLSGCNDSIRLVQMLT